LNKILPLVILLSISLIFGNQIPDAFAVTKITKLTMLYKSTSGASATILVNDKNGDSTASMYNTMPSPVTVTDGNTFMVLPMTGDADLKSKTAFYLDLPVDIQFDFNHKNFADPEIHTSCSWKLPNVDDDPKNQFPLTASVTDGGTTHTLILVSWDYPGTDPDCIFNPPDMVGGHGGITDKTSLIVAGAQVSSSWMIPLLVSAVGIGIFVVSYKKE